MSEDILVSNLDHVPGYRVAKVIDIVRGTSVKARFIGRDIIASLRILWGGEVKEYGKLLEVAVSEAIENMKKEAKKIGANAVIGVRIISSFASSADGGVWSGEIIAYGTAVVLERTD